MEKMKLHVKVMDDDPMVDDKLGHCTIDLMELGLKEEPIEVERIIDVNTYHKGAKIYLKLSYKESI